MISHQKEKRSIGWMGLSRGHKARPLEWLAEKFIFLVSLSAILMVFLIFVFVMREAFPIFAGEADSSLAQKIIPASDIDKISPEQLRTYLGLTPEEFKSKDHETLQLLMEVREEGAKEVPNDKDA